jgi:hypothetical protein
MVLEKYAIKNKNIREKMPPRPRGKGAPPWAAENIQQQGRGIPAQSRAGEKEFNSK